MTNLAIILVDLENGRFGHAAALDEMLAGKRVLQHTVDRAARIDGLDGILLLHPEGQSLEGLYETPSDAPPITSEPMSWRESDNWLRGVIDSGRKWSLTAWRGGIGGMTIYDELLPAYPLLQAARAKGAESIVVLRGDWCCIDPVLASKQLELHRSAPEAMKLTFTQAPPGLSPLVVHASVLEDIVEHSATIANLLCYNPNKPTIDPVGKDVNVPVPASVRDQYRRFVFDTPRAVDHLRLVAGRLGEAFWQADAAAITDTSRQVEIDEPWHQAERLPQQLNVELTPRRIPNGPIVPQHYLTLDRPDMAVDTAGNLLAQFAETGDTAVLFGGLGDPLLHPDCFEILERAIDEGLLGVGIETDLLADEDAIDRLASMPLDVITVRMNADSAETYKALMGIDEYARLLDNLKRLFRHRNDNRQSGSGFQGWVVPRLVKVADNLSDLETFFERWMTVSGWAVVDRALTGRGLIPEMSPVPMEVPRPADRPIELQRQKSRLTVLSDGRVCLCGEDWLGRLPLGVVGEQPLAALWREAGRLADEPGSAEVVCPRCVEWLEARRELMSRV